VGKSIRHAAVFILDYFTGRGTPRAARNPLRRRCLPPGLRRLPPRLLSSSSRIFFSGSLPVSSRLDLAFPCCSTSRQPRCFCCLFASSPTSSLEFRYCDLVFAVLGTFQLAKVDGTYAQHLPPTTSSTIRHGRTTRKMRPSTTSPSRGV
jgi:hypothetical protein